MYKLVTTREFMETTNLGEIKVDSLMIIYPVRRLPISAGKKKTFLLNSQCISVLYSNPLDNHLGRASFWHYRILSN